MAPRRGTWQSASARTRGTLAFVLLTLDDEAEHRRRLDDRRRDLTHVPEPSWADVLARAAARDPWAGATCLRLDAGRPLDELVTELASRLAGL